MGEIRVVLRVEELEIVEVAIADALADASAEAPAPVAARRVDAFMRVVTAGRGGAESSSGGDRTSVVVHVEVEESTGVITSAETERGRPVHPETAARLACDATLHTIVHGRLEPIGQGRTTREPSRAMRRAVRRRSGGRCEWIGCDDKAHLQLHHLHWWSNGGPTEWWNLAALCWRHHHLVHEKGWRIDYDRGTGAMRCYTPNGAELLDPRPPTDVPPLDVTTAKESIVPLWAGETFDLSACVDAVLHAGNRSG